MNTFVLEKWDDEGKQCTFYTVRWDDSARSETDNFFDKYENHSTLVVHVQELLSLILDQIGDNHGAKDAFFNRKENEVDGLPPKGRVLGLYFPSFPLRLYALKITEHLVILFNGGIKDSATNQKSSLHLHWREACQFAKKIDAAIRNSEIIVDENNWELKPYDNTKEIVL